MPRPLTWIVNSWRFLTKPRSLRPGRRLPRSRRSGVAILVVLATMMILTVVVSELAYTSRVRFLVAAHSRDRVQSFWLARSGVGIYQLILLADQELQSNEMVSQFLPGGVTLWQWVPLINTGLMRMLLGGTSASDLDDELMQDFVATGQVSDEIREESMGESKFSGKNFLDFDGDFSAELQDHESKININKFAGESSTVLQESTVAQRLYALMSGTENDQWFHERNLDRWELIGNLKDWVDEDNVRSGGLGGYEDNLYNTLDNPYLAKNAPFDTIQEIRLVDGWQGEVFDKFGEHMTIWGAGKININTAPPEMMFALMRSCQESTIADAQLEQCQTTLEDSQITLIGWTDGKDFAQDVAQYCGLQLDEDCMKDAVGENSSVFTVTSTGMVGTSSVTITAVLDYSKKSAGTIEYWRVD